MKFLLSILFIAMIVIIIESYNTKKTASTHQKIVFATSAQYPPFEYIENNQLTGFDIELARHIGKEIGLKVEFANMSFSSILAALESKAVDAAISAIAITEERKKNFDFSDSYYSETIAIVYPKDKPIIEKDNLTSKIVATQLGTTMEIWLKKIVPQKQILSFDTSNQAVTALLAEQADGALLDLSQSIIYTKNYPELKFSVIAKSEEDYGIALRKNSHLKDKINHAIKSLENKGIINDLKKKWLGEIKWNN